MIKTTRFFFMFAYVLSTCLDKKISVWTKSKLIFLSLLYGSICNASTTHLMSFLDGGCPNRFSKKMTRLLSNQVVLKRENYSSQLHRVVFYQVHILGIIFYFCHFLIVIINLKLNSIVFDRFGD